MKVSHGERLCEPVARQSVAAGGTRLPLVRGAHARGALGPPAVRAPRGEIATSGVALGPPGAQLEAAQLFAREPRALERVVLLARESVPEEHGELASDGDARR
jgi:hypothetical protein